MAAFQASGKSLTRSFPSLVRTDADERARDLVDRAMKRTKRHAAELIREDALQRRIEMLPEAAAARDDIFPEPRLALVHAGRDAMAEGRAFERGTHALLVHGVTRLVQRREQRIAEVVLVDARGDANVAGGEFGAERMVREIEPAARRVVSHPPGDAEAEIELRRLGKFLPQAGVVRRRLIADRPHHRDEFAPQFVEQAPDRRRRHAFVGIVDMRVGDVFVRGEELGVFATQCERLFQIRHHRGEVVRGSRASPGVVGRSAVGVRARHPVGRNADSLVVLAARDPDQACVVVVTRQALAKRRERVEQLADLGRDPSLMRKARQRRHLAAARLGAALRHVGRLIPAEHGAGPAQVADLAQAHLEVGEHLLGASAIACGLAFGRARPHGDPCLPGLRHRCGGRRYFAATTMIST
jgi:hypothetical protein